MDRLKRISISSAVVAFLLFLPSCVVNQGNTAIKDFGKYANLEKRKSTKQDIYKSFGQPHNVKYTGPTSQWGYFNLQSTDTGAGWIPFVGLVVGGTNDKIFGADFFFDQKGILESYSTNEKTSYTNQWVGIARGTASHLKNTQANRVEAEMKKLGYPFDKKEARKARDMGTAGTDQQ